ncbi:hypothetical protein BH09MYX1_BH09MYX1_40070 [soil metagenome]
MKLIDRRALRTRRTLREALIELVLAQGWEKTSVQAICDHVKMDRSTFLLHFADTEQLLLSAFDDLPGTLKRVDDRPFAFLRDLIVQVRAYYPLTRAIRKRASLTVVPRLRSLVVALVTLDVEPRRSTAGAVERDATARFIAGGIVDTLVWWIEEGAAVDARALEATLRGMSTAALGELASPTRDTLPQFPAKRRS